MAESIDVRSKEQVSVLQDLLKNGHPTIILIYADWCGHCHRYMPTWADLEKTPGRTANMAKVHHDMQDAVPEIAKADIQGYPSVIKVNPDGTLESYTTPESGEKTNAMPAMRDMPTMKAEVQGTKKVVQGGGGSRSSRSSSRQAGGSVLEAFVGAVQQAGPAALLLLTHSAVSKGRPRPSRRAPKRQTRRGSSRRRAFRTRGNRGSTRRA